MTDCNQTVIVPKHLALRLSHWHSGMDSVYAVSSSGLARKAVPLEVFTKALWQMEKNAEKSGEYATDAREIVLTMRTMLGFTAHEEMRETIARAMARTLWAEAWAREAEERGHALRGDVCDLAPQTPDLAYRRCDCLITQLLERNRITLPEFIEKYSKDCGINLHNFGHELILSITGIGGELDIKERMPYCEIYYYDLADEWIEG